MIEQLKEVAITLVGIAAFMAMFAIQCMIMVLPIMLGFWLWKIVF